MSNTFIHVRSTVFLALIIGAFCTHDVTHGQDQPVLRHFFRWRFILSMPPEEYATDEAIRVAENVLLYQHDNGGWPKNIRMTRKIGVAEREKLYVARNQAETLIDNGATVTEIRYLALVNQHRPDRRFVEAALRGLNYLLEAQYDNGGWPMIYPIRKGYYQHITFNDNSMIGVMRLLRDVAEGDTPFDFTDEDLRQRAKLAIQKGLDVILKCQVEVQGKPTVWCAQHDEIDFRPRGARTFELRSLSGQESVGVVKYLMQIENPSPEIVHAIESAIDWFEGSRIDGLAVKWIPEPSAPRGRDRVVIEDPEAPTLWARFYDIETNRPIYVGRDGIAKDHLSKIELERRTNYSYLGPYATNLLEKDYPAWLANQASE